MHTHESTFQAVQPFIASHDVVLSPQLVDHKNVESLTVCGRLTRVTPFAPLEEMRYIDSLGDEQTFSDVYLELDDGLGKILVLTDQETYASYADDLSEGQLLLVEGMVFILDRFQLFTPEKKPSTLSLFSKKQETPAPKLIPHPHGQDVRIVLTNLTIL